MDLTFPLLRLRDQRKTFHSEADFQFALAWEIQKCYPEAKIRPEYCLAEIEPSIYIDILVIMDGLWYPIELKYKTLKGIKEYNGEIFKLKNHGAQDLGRYDYLSNIMRIERLSKTITVFGKGYAILLTNDPAYWFDTPRRDTVYYEFRLNDGAVKTGEMKWSDHVGVTKGDVP